MNLYHATTPRAAARILRVGLEDHTTRQEPQFGPSVWFSETPSDENGGAKGRSVDQVRMPKRVALKYALHYPDNPELGALAKDFLMPAAVANQYPRRPFEFEEQEAKRHV